MPFNLVGHILIFILIFFSVHICPYLSSFPLSFGIKICVPITFLSEQTQTVGGPGYSRNITNSTSDIPDTDLVGFSAGHSANGPWSEFWLTGHVNSMTSMYFTRLLKNEQGTHWLWGRDDKVMNSFRVFKLLAKDYSFNSRHFIPNFYTSNRFSANNKNRVR